jgi:branched-chain amino acid transport system substrate-binding protein
MRKIVAAGLALAFICITAGVTDAAKTNKPILIGVYFPMTGPSAPYGQMGWQGLKLAHKFRPTVLGRPVKLILVDNKSDKVESANAVNRLIKRHRVKAIIGGLTSSNSLAGAPFCEKAKVPMVSPWATNPLVTQGRQYVFRVCFIDPFQGRVAAAFARKTLKAKTAAVLIDKSQDYCVGIAAFFMRAFRQMGGRVVLKTYYQTGDQDFTAQLSAAKAAGPDLLYVPGYFAEDALIARQAREQGLKAPLMSGDAAQAPELIKIGKQAVEGLFLTTHFDAQGVVTAQGRRFVKLYLAAYKQSPDSVAALSWDAYNVLLNAIARAGTTRSDAVVAKLNQVKNYPAVTGVLTIVNHSAVKPAVILKVKGGKFVYVETVKP